MCEPSSVLTVTVTGLSVALIAVTLPCASTVTYAGALLVHVTFLFVAFSGSTVATNVSVSPSTLDSSVLLRETLSTLITFAVTVTAHVAVCEPSSVVTVTVTGLSVALTAVTLPCASTVTYSGSLLVHVTFLFVAFSGSTVATNVSVFPSTNVVLSLLKDTPVTATIISFGRTSIV